MKTREKILQQSLLLFNEFGEPNVTTAQISDHLDISQGNLYYHFRSKADITWELYLRFEREMLDMLAPYDARDYDLEDLWFEVHLTFEIIARNRFLYRNLVDLHARMEKLPRHWRGLQRTCSDVIHLICQGLIQSGMMKAGEDELNTLCEQIVMTETFWLNHWQVFDHNKDGMDPITSGAYQTVCLLAPYMTEDARTYLLTVARAYL